MTITGKFRLHVVILSALWVSLSSHAQQLPTDELVDSIIETMFSSIAKRWGYNLLAAPEDGAAQIGKVYYITEPSCSRQLNELATKGEGVRVFEALSLPEDSIPPPPVRGQWTSIRIASVIGSAARLNLRAALPDKQVELDLALEALDKTNAQVLVGSRSVSSVLVRRALERSLTDEGVTRLEDLGNGATGALAPHAELLVQKFEFDMDLVKVKKAGFWASFLDLFGVRLSADAKSRTVSGFVLPTNSILAFKSVTYLFDDKKCVPK